MSSKALNEIKVSVARIEENMDNLIDNLKATMIKVEKNSSWRNRMIGAGTLISLGLTYGIIKVV